MDWGDGEYERTAAALEAASRRAVETAAIAPGTDVLDLGSGTGNAALEAAGRGARVVAVDPSGRLLDVCRARADRAGLTVTTRPGDAGRIPAADASFDVVLSVFAVIFAPDAELAASEMLRVVRPGGRVVVTSWVPRGPIAEAGALLRDAMVVVDPSSAKRAAPAWGDPAFVRALFERRGAEVAIEEATIAFEAASPRAWFEDQERHHPIWRGVRDALSAHPGAWDRVRAQAVERLTAGNQDRSRFRATSEYLVVTARRAHRASS